MSDEITIIVQNKLRKKINEVKIKRPKTFENLRDFVNKKIKELPQYYTIYISKNHKGIEIRSNEQYQIYRNKIIYILEKDIKDIAPTLVQNDDVYFEESMANVNENDKCLNCSKYITNEEQILCYESQKILHNKYLENKALNNDNEINEQLKDKNGQFVDNISNILKNILIRFKEVDSLLPNSNEQLIEIINKFESKSIIVQINNISNIILEELKIIENYIKSKKNNNLSKNTFNRNRDSNLTLPNINKNVTQPDLLYNIPYSCIPRIRKKFYPDISYEKIGEK